MQKHVEPLSIATVEEDNACPLDFLVDGKVGHESRLLLPVALCHCLRSMRCDVWHSPRATLHGQPATGSTSCCRGVTQAAEIPLASHVAPSHAAAMFSVTEAEAASATSMSYLVLRLGPSGCAGSATGVPRPA
jgi:hypothetical protein